ncbi:RNA polymerase sigma factor [Pseudomaricurvus alkylphenolicus]|uniref:RNA polymerase sigma factor n=1 Tax=Pseudomaricurvus alkylphenolicus TaxID=1306991 RepID=UPI0014218A6B|nr:RNA polymerase sigma factor [Pseudomaricurvus alkylphenolicus]NIB40747.1 RNA polymerase sigma factor [Pseudomaricurvus alkylphenolicus]
MQNQEDRQLVAKILAKDRVAFDHFFDVYFARLHRFCSSRISAADSCEDIVQETLIKAIRHLDSYRGEASLFTWLCQICRHEIANWYRRHQRRQPTTVSLDDDPHIRAVLESLQIEQGLTETEKLVLQNLVQLTLDYLPDNYGRVLEWKYLEGLSVKEIDEHLAIGKTAVQSLLARARGAFRQAFRDLQYDLPQDLSTQAVLAMRQLNGRP